MANKSFIDKSAIRFLETQGTKAQPYGRENDRATKDHLTRKNGVNNILMLIISHSCYTLTEIAPVAQVDRATDS